MNVRIFFNPLDAKSEKVYQVPVGTQIIEFLQDEFPSGFNAPVRIFAAQNELDPDDWDHVIAEEERITILLMPAASLGIGFAAGIGTALLKAAIAVAIGYIINLIFKPKAPSDLNDGDTSPVYSIGATRNQQRLGAPIEVLYGSVLYPPSFASAPYVYNVQDTNDQYVDELLCLGHGMFAIQDIYVGNTPVSAMEVDTVKYWLIDSTEHNNKQSNVEDIVNADVINSSNPLPFYPNMYTSPEVSDLDFKSGETESTTGALAFAGDANEASLDLSGNPILGNISGVDSSINIQTGDRLTLAGTTSNNIEFTVGSIVVDPTNPLLMTIFQRANDSAKISTEIPLAPTPTYQINQTVVNYRFGPYRAQREGDVVTEIWCDFTFPQGLYSVDGTDGDIDPAAYSLKFTYQEIDENGDDLPGGTQHSFTYEFKTTSRSPYRGSVSSGPLTPGFYNVTVERDGSFNDQRVVEVCQWSGLRSAIQLDPLLESYSDTTLLAIRMKASNGLGQAARERVRVRATRVLMEGVIVGDFTIGNNAGPVHGAQTEEDFAFPPAFGVLTGPLTRLVGTESVDNPNLIIAGTTPRGEYGGQPSLDVTVPDYSTTPITLNYQPATLDYRTTDAAFTAWLVANDGLATTYQVWNPSTESSNPITAIKDIWTNQVYGLGRPLAGLDLATMDALESDWAGGYPQPEFNAVFAERGTGYDAMQTIASMCGGNIVQDGGLVTIAFDQVQDVRAALFSSANIVRDSLNILYTFNTDGEYDSVQVEYRDPSTWDVAYVVYPEGGIDHDTYNLFGCTDETYATEMATYLWNVRARRRKQVKFQTELEGLIPVFNSRIGVSHPLPQWGQSGVFVQQISATEWFVDQDLDWTTDNVMIIRSEVGTGSPLYTVTQGASPNIVVFAEEPVGLIATAELREPTNYMFGVADELIKDFQVTKVSPSSDNIIAIEAQTYDELIYNGAPPHMGGVGQGYSELVLLETEDFDGYHNGFGIIAGKDDDAGQFLMVNNRGHGTIRTSLDGGDTWNAQVVVGTGGSGTGYPCNYIQRDDVNDRWWQLQYRSETRQVFFNVSYDEGVTWSRIVDYGSYTHGFLVTGDTIRSGRQSASNLSLWENTPSDEITTYTLVDFKYDSTAGFDPRVYWTQKVIGNLDGVDWFACTTTPEAGGDGDNRTTIFIYQERFFTDPLIYEDTCNDKTQLATRGQGEMLVRRNVIGSVVTFDNVKLNGGFLYSTPWPTVDVDFGVDISLVSFCYAAGPDIYLIAATEAADDQRVHFRYCNGDDFGTWNSYPEVISIYAPGKSRQLYWSHNNVYYWGYAQEYDSSSPDHLALIRFDMDLIKPKAPAVIINQTSFNTSFDAQVGDTFDPQGVATIGTISEYGIGGFESIPSTSSGYCEIIPEGLPQLDHRVFCIEMSYYPKDFNVDSGIFAFGSSSDSDWQIRIMCQTDGTINATMYAGQNGPVFQLISSNAVGEALVVGEWYKICVECDGFKARLYIDGETKVTKTYYQTEVWASDTRCLMGWTQVSNRFHGVICNTRISNGYRYRGNYTPATGPFP